MLRSSAFRSSRSSSDVRPTSNRVRRVIAEAMEPRRMMAVAPVSFQPRQLVDTGIYADVMTLADLNSDGKLDIVTIDPVGRSDDGRFASILGNGDGTFQQPTVQSYPERAPNGAITPRLALGDFDDDGKIDAAVGAPFSGGLYFFKGQGNGQFNSAVKITFNPSMGIVVRGMTAGDFNRDGIDDLAISGATENKIGFVYGGVGTFGGSQRHVATPTSIYGISTADYDLDGFDDVGGHGATTYGILTNTHLSTPSYLSFGNLPGGGVSWESAVGKMRGQSTRPSAVIVRAPDTGGSMSVIAVRDPLQSTSYTGFALGDGFPGGISMADFNRDGLDDVLLGFQAPNRFIILTSNGDGTLNAPTESLTTGLPSVLNVVAADVNGDGFPDALLASGAISVALQTAPSLVVTTAVDEDDGTSVPTAGTGTSLREAVNYARTLRGTQTIIFAPALGNANAVINLTNGPISMPENTHITLDNDHGRITIQGNGTQQGFIIPGTAWLTLRDLTIKNFRSATNGGAVHVDTVGTFDAERVTFVDNVAMGQGAAVYSQTLTWVEIRNSTFYNNTGEGAVALDASNGTAVLEHNTISSNTIGVRAYNGTVTLRNNLIANNTTADVSANGGALTGSHNLIRTGSMGGLTNTITADPLLNEFANNGGSTNTVSFQPGSPAINAAAALANITTDQRGIARPQHGSPDIGAFEARLSATPIFATSTLTVTPDAAPINLAQATSPNPAGGTFSGPGVSNGVFNPAGLLFGVKTITYTATQPDTDVPGVATLTINVNAVRVLTSAQVSFYVPETPREGTPFVVNVLIANLRDQYGDAFVPTSGTVTLQPQGLDSQTVTLTAQQLSQSTITVPFTVRYPNAANTRTITADVTLDGFNVSNSYFPDILNVAPSNLQLSAATSVRQGTSFTLSGSFLDPGEWNAFSLNIDWGDGSTQTVNLGGSRTFSVDKTYAVGYTPTSNHTIRVTAADNLGGQTSTTRDVQVVRNNALLVTTATDENNGTSDAALGSGTSLREALRYAELNPGADTITFAAGLNGQTIALSSGWSDVSADESGSAFVISGDVTIAGPTSGADITLAIAAGVQKRHFLVNSSSALALSNLTLTNGRASNNGGAIWSFGSLTVRNSTLAGNHAGSEGGAIQAWGGSPLLRIENSTIAGNSAGNFASAISVGSTNASMDHVTIVDNTSPTANGTIWIYETSLTMRNSIVARNTNDGTAHNGGNGSGTFNAASTHNLVAGGSWQGLNPANNTLGVNVTALRLGTLADNGGPTPTIALLPGSVAINAGTALANVSTDQRGTSRSQGASPDIGAYERSATNAVATASSYEYDARMAIHVDFTADASVTVNRADLQLTNLTTGQPVAANVGAWIFNDTGTRATLTLNNLLADGNYRATLGGQSVDFFVLAGDFDRDRTVNFSDLLILAQNYSQSDRTNATGDVNYDGDVNFDDLLALSQNYSKTLAAFAPAVSSTAHSAATKRRISSTDLLR